MKNCYVFAQSVENRIKFEYQEIVVNAEASENELFCCFFFFFLVSVFETVFHNQICIKTDFPDIILFLMKN